MVFRFSVTYSIPSGAEVSTSSRWPADNLRAILETATPPNIVWVVNAKNRAKGLALLGHSHDAAVKKTECLFSVVSLGVRRCYLQPTSFTSLGRHSG